MTTRTTRVRKALDSLEHDAHGPIDTAERYQVWFRYKKSAPSFRLWTWDRSYNDRPDAEAYILHTKNQIGSDLEMELRICPQHKQIDPNCSLD